MKPAAVSMAASFEPKVFMPMFFQARCREVSHHGRHRKDQ